MKFCTRMLCLPALVMLLAASCAKEASESYDKFETLALGAWMEKYHPELVNNLQEEGGYYVDVLDAGDMEAKPINDTICWVKFDFSGRDLAGNIILTRRATDAKLAGTENPLCSDRRLRRLRLGRAHLQHASADGALLSPQADYRGVDRRRPRLVKAPEENETEDYDFLLTI